MVAPASVTASVSAIDKDFSRPPKTHGPGHSVMLRQPRRPPTRATTVTQPPPPSHRGPLTKTDKTDRNHPEPRGAWTAAMREDATSTASCEINLIMGARPSKARAPAATPSPPPEASSGSSLWSELPRELAGLVLRRLLSLADRVRFGSVCRHWRDAAWQQASLLPPVLPWTITLFNTGIVQTIPDGEVHRLCSGKPAFCSCSSKSWLLMIGSDDDTVSRHFLENPVSGATTTTGQSFELARVATAQDISRTAPLRNHAQCRFVASSPRLRATTPSSPLPSNVGMPSCRCGPLSLSGFRSVLARLSDTFYNKLRAISFRLCLGTYETWRHGTSAAWGAI
ncbi:hypothetical protein QYE76_006339 [Lolium multiflorum]|uniref:F-box domain-containing protein n=1 Tax=Lolium multiflorum TaxID=4521 RepID=A0AAD8RWL5_LOLMU|nr:hypothetical protein QYE76_006339 [Lolium multiflorum]